MDCHIPSDELFIVSKYDSGRSFATISIARPEQRNAFCSVEEMEYPLIFSFISPVLGELPFLFWCNF